ncbi:MAG TPA: methylated DNA-protein cysteine methyltransferase [Tepidisphaeraceae bacterium]|nr:methylated DNA-protein cysteine methyltransferase [Tepidisphaeraceae bacterium]
MYKRKTWREKLADDKGFPRVIPVTGAMARRFGKGTCVIPSPKAVDAIMKKVSRGKLLTINQIREELAKKHKADFACPITTGIFAWIAAHAAEEDAADGKKKITPYWRTLKNGGELNPKYPGGIANVKRKLKAEGHRFFSKGKRWFVAA